MYLIFRKLISRTKILLQIIKRSKKCKTFFPEFMTKMPYFPKQRITSFHHYYRQLHRGFNNYKSPRCLINVDTDIFRLIRCTLCALVIVTLATYGSMITTCECMVCMVMLVPQGAQLNCQIWKASFFFLETACRDLCIVRTSLAFAVDSTDIKIIFPHWILRKDSEVHLKRIHQESQKGKCNMCN